MRVCACVRSAEKSPPVQISPLRPSPGGHGPSGWQEATPLWAPFGLEALRGFWARAPWKGARWHPAPLGLGVGTVVPLALEPRSPASPTGTRNPHLQRVPAHGASCLNPVLALRKRARALNPSWCGQRWEPGSGWAGARPPSGSATSGAPSPAALQTSPLARMRVPVPFLFLPGDAMSVRGLSGWPWGSEPPGAAKQGGERSAALGPSRTFRGGWDRPFPPSRL